MRGQVSVGVRIMTPGQARVALGTFLLVSAGVAVNALFLQSDADSSGRTGMGRMSGPPRLAGRGAMVPEATVPRDSERSYREEQALRIARFAAEPGSIAPLAAGPGEVTDAETVRAIQRELKLRGYGPVPVNGTIGLSTRAAIMAFEFDHGMALSAEASERLLKRIVLGGAEPADPNRSAIDGASARATEVVRSVQQWLAALGYQPGQADGRLGEETVKAIREFEVDKGLVPRGRISAELVGRLNEATTAKSSQR
jgi:peptidoglycan hydrolase-like protein with peptidoglycan-binding domain